METVNLTQLDSGQEGIIVELHGGHGFCSRMESLGIRVGVRIRKISAQLMRGPVTIQAGSTQAAIGFGMAKKIIVQKVKKIR